MFSPRLSLGQTCFYCKALHQWIGRDQFLAVGTFFHVFEATVSPPFCLFYKRFPLLSDLIDLARWVKINTYFIPRLRLIMLSGTGSNRGTKSIPRLARFNPRLALIGFSGTRARSFAAMVTWRHNSPLRLRPSLTQHSWLNLTLFLQLACGLNHGILQ